MNLILKAVTLIFWILVLMAWMQGWEGTLGWLPAFGACNTQKKRAHHAPFFIHCLRN